MLRGMPDREGEFFAIAKITFGESQRHRPPFTRDGGQRRLVAKAGGDIPAGEIRKATDRKWHHLGFEGQSQVNIIEVGVPQVQPIIAPGGVAALRSRAGRIKDEGCSVNRCLGK